MIFIRILVLNFVICTIAQAGAPSKVVQEKAAIYVNVKSYFNGEGWTNIQEVNIHKASQLIASGTPIILGLGNRIVCTLNATFERDKNQSSIELLLATFESLKKVLMLIKKNEEEDEEEHKAQIRRELAAVESEEAALAARKAVLKAHLEQPITQITAPQAAHILAGISAPSNQSSGKPTYNKIAKHKQVAPTASAKK